jgi:AraC-like DNA-binding protein
MSGGPSVSAAFERLPDIRGLGLMLFDPIWAERGHESGECEMLHIVSGRMVLELPGGRWPAGPGDTLLVPPRTRHRDAFDPAEGLEVFFCSFAWPAAPEYFRLVDNRVAAALPAHRKAELAVLFDQLRADLAGPTDSDRLLARSRVHTILLLLLREACAARRPAEKLSYGRARRQSLMRRAKEYLAAHYAGCVSLDEMAAALGVSSYHLSHVFSEESDFSLFAYLTALRMDKARALLRKDGLNVREVARAVGYENANYFAKVFRKHCGCAPREYAAGRDNGMTR